MGGDGAAATACKVRHGCAAAGAAAGKAEPAAAATDQARPTGKRRAATGVGRALVGRPAARPAELRVTCHIAWALALHALRPRGLSGFLVFWFLDGLDSIDNLDRGGVFCQRKERDGLSDVVSLQLEYDIRYHSCSVVLFITSGVQIIVVDKIL